MIFFGGGGGTKPDTVLKVTLVAVVCLTLLKNAGEKKTKKSFLCPAGDRLVFALVRMQGTMMIDQVERHWVTLKI